METLDGYGDKILEKIAYKLHQLGKQHTQKEKYQEKNIQTYAVFMKIAFFLDGEYCTFNLGKVREKSQIY